jgi:hypothetical protein
MVKRYSRSNRIAGENRWVHRSGISEDPLGFAAMVSTRRETSWAVIPATADVRFPSKSL